VKEDADKETTILRSDDRAMIFKVVQSIVREKFKKQQRVTKIRNSLEVGDGVIEAIVKEIDLEKITTGHKLRSRIEDMIQAIYDKSPAREKFYKRLENTDQTDLYPDVNAGTAGPWTMLPDWRRRPGRRGGGSYGNDPDARELLDEYEQLAAQAIAAVASNRGEKEVSLNISTMGEGPERGDPEKSDDAEPTDRSLDIVLTWGNWWDLINADWTVRLRQPSPLSRKLQKFLQEEMDRLDEKAWQAESILIESDAKRKVALAAKYGVSARIDKLEKRGPTGEVILRGAEAAGQYRRNEALSARLGISTGEVENMWREIKALKRFPASKILERVKRSKYF
jgi:hypothetical protein